LGEDGVWGHGAHIDLSWSGLAWVELITVVVIVVIIAITVAAVSINKGRLPGGVAAKGAMVVDSPGQDPVVGSEGHAMHGAERDLDNPSRAREIGVGA
jgi:hypothetical protein